MSRTTDIPNRIMAELAKLPRGTPIEEGLTSGEVATRLSLMERLVRDHLRTLALQGHVTREYRYREGDNGRVGAFYHVLNVVGRVAYADTLARMKRAGTATKELRKRSRS